LLPSKEALGAEVLLLTSVALLPVFSNFPRKARFPKILQLQDLTALTVTLEATDKMRLRPVPPRAPETMSIPADGELIDLLNEHGEIVGVLRRGEMRRLRHPHRCVYILVFNGRGELFIHQRTASKDLFPSYWDLTVGGVPLAGEPFDAAAQREASEEIGVMAPARPLFPFRFVDASTNVHSIVYRIEHDGPFILQPEEIVRGEFVPLGEIGRRILRDPFCPDGLAVWYEFQRRDRTFDRD
jgi:isopentenyldiphosphate isomerase